MAPMPETSAAFTAVDLSRLPAPSVIEELSYEAIYTTMLAALADRAITKLGAEKMANREKRLAKKIWLNHCNIMIK